MSDEFYPKHYGKSPKLTSTAPFGVQGAAAKRAWEVEDSRAREATKGHAPSDMRSRTTTSAAMWQTLGKQANPASSEKGRVDHFDIKAASGERLPAYFGKLAGDRDSLKGTIVQLFDLMFRQQPWGVARSAVAGCSMKVCAQTR